LILCFDCVSTNAFNSLNFSKHSPLDFNKYTHTFLEKSSMYVTKYLAPQRMWSSWGIQMHNLQGLCGTHPSITWKWFAMLFSLNAPFTNKWRCRARHVSKVHTTHHVLECMHYWSIEEQ
jgi:hypothetical protein